MAHRRYVLDEDVPHATASLLRSRGLNADSAKELGRLGMTDPHILLSAAENQQTLVTHNRKDFRALHEAWHLWRAHWSTEVALITGRPISLSPHAGILILPQMPYQELARIIEEFDETAEAMSDRFLVWSRSRGWFEIEP